MSGEFRKALVWHMSKHDTKIADLVRATGISRDVINKLLSRENSSTAVENAVMLASYYGKTVEQFIRCDETQVNPIAALSEMLTESEQEMLAAQVRGLIARRAQK